MSSKSIIHQARLNEWESRIADQKNSGLSGSEWCRQNNLSKDRYSTGDAYSKMKPYHRSSLRSFR